MNATKTTNDAIREYVRQYGWAAAMSHPAYGPAIEAMRREQRRFEDAIQD